ncbi:MAG: YibE/F family protein [Candidatus Levybacteria bacterium]|nr:YibE/F family protein [Candidatus Levybacteria bacterium]
MTKIIIPLLLPLFLFLLVLFSSVSIKAQENGSSMVSPQVPKEEILEAKVTKILEEKQIIPLGGKEKQLYQKLEMFVARGSLERKTIVVENGNLPITFLQKYKVGDRLVLTYNKDFQGKDVYYITDYVRRDGLLLLFFVFVIIAVVIAKWRGFTSLIGMAISFLVIFKFVLPQISSGKDPITIAIIGSLIMVPVTFYLSHGLNKKTTVAIIGTIVSLIITGILANLFVEITKLTGFASEEANFLQAFQAGVINIKGLLLAGIIIGGLGIFDDVTISQAAIVESIKDASLKITFVNLYSRAMKVGHDHIASVVNTLVLVYTGAALPLLILFTNNPRPFSQVINLEFIAEEIVRTLVASIGLILAVPITTLLAALFFSKDKRQIKS